MASVAVYIECPITGRILGASRKNDHNAWGLPGGHVEEGEEEVFAAVRELYEETGILVRKHCLFELFRRTGGVAFGLPDGYWHDGTIVRIGKPLPGEGKVDWITPEDLIAGPFGEYNRAFLKAIGKIK